MQSPHSHASCSLRPYHPHPSLSDSEKEMSGGKCTKTTEIASYAGLAFRASVAEPWVRKSFTTEGTEIGAQRSQRRETLLTRRAAKLFVAVAGHGVVVYHAGGLH